MADPRSDVSLLAAFEACTIPLAEWTHRAHVRVGYLYLSQHSLAEAIERMRHGLLALNAVHQVPDELERGYHETITVSFVRLINARIAQENHFASSEHFCDAHSDLLDKRALLRYYTRERLMSHQAKRQFLEPDLAPLP